MNRKVLFAAAGAAFAAVCTPTHAETAFLEFPHVEAVSAADVPAFAWIVRQGSRTSVQFTRAPDFRRKSLVIRSDTYGEPVTDVIVAPSGDFLAFTTGAPRAEAAFNPASLVNSPEVTLWAMSTAGQGKPVKLGEAREPNFSPDGRHLLFKRANDLWTLDTRALNRKPKLFAKGGAKWSQFAWTRNGDLIFIDERRGYSFLGRYRPGAPNIEWLVTGADRLALPVISPSGDTVAFLRFPGRKHSTTYDQTEAEPFSVATLDLATGSTRTIWSTRGPAITLGMDDPEGALRWASNDTLIFYSEDDGWGRLYALARNGGAPRPITAANCMVAESEYSIGQLFVVHNCQDRDTRQMSVIDARRGDERSVASADPVIAQVRAAAGYAAFVGADPEHAPLLRIVDIQNGTMKFKESYSDYGYRSTLSGSPPRSVHLSSTDGLRFSGQLFTPSSPGPHPAIVYVHGGPQRQMFPAFHYSGYYANDYAINRRLAEEGYVVLAVNYRSGIGYGRAFRDAPGRAWRGASEYVDVLSAGRWLAQQPNVDPARIGIWGGSYGGLLTAQALGRNSDLFKAGVAVHGVYDWSWPSPIPGHLSPSTYFGVDEKEREQARSSSPIARLDGWRSPVLLFSGDADMNVDVVETIDLAERLRERGVEARTVIIPGEAHDFVRQSTWERLWRELDSFFSQQLRNGS